MHFWKEMNYDVQLGGCLKVVITRILYFIDYVLPSLNFSLCRSREVHFNISRITCLRVYPPSYSFLCALDKKSTVMSNSKTVPITNRLCIGFFKSKKKKKN